MAVRACATASVELGERLDRIGAARERGFQPAGGIGDAKCADRARRTLQRMRQRAASAGKRGERCRSGWPPGPKTSPAPRARGRRRPASCAGDGRYRSDRHRERAAAMASSRSVPGEAAWRNPISPADRSGSASFGQPITEMVNGTFGVRRKFACFWRKVAAIDAHRPRISRTRKALWRRAVNDD